MKRTKKKILLYSVFFIILIGCVYGVFYLKSVADYQKKIKETTFEQLDFSTIPDGVYIGEYDVDYIYAKVKVFVQDGMVTQIDLLEHKNERGKNAETIINNIIEKQTIHVDTITGATNSSIVIRKAVENALKQNR